MTVYLLQLLKNVHGVLRSHTEAINENVEDGDEAWIFNFMPHLKIKKALWIHLLGQWIFDVQESGGCRWEKDAQIGNETTTCISRTKLGISYIAFIIYCPIVIVTLRAAVVYVQYGILVPMKFLWAGGLRVICPFLILRPVSQCDKRALRVRCLIRSALE